MSCPPLPLAELVAAFRQQGESVARYAPAAGEAFSCCADWLMASLAAHLDDSLSLEEAVTESGWSYEALRRRLREEPQLNAGQLGAPLIRRGDLPRLGAARGPRPAYGKRKPKAEGAAPAPQQEQFFGDAETAGQQSPLVSAPTDASGHKDSGVICAQVVTRATAEEVMELDQIAMAAGAEVCADVIPDENGRPFARHRPHNRKRTRSTSVKDRFNGLLALATLP